MSRGVAEIGRAYQRMLAGSRFWSHFPLPLARRLNRLWAHLIQPERALEAARIDAMQRSGAVEQPTQELARRRALFADACLYVFRHAGFDEAWLKRHVHCDKQTLAALRADQGALVVTWHSPLYHTLFVVLGLLGFSLTALVSPEEASPVWHYIGRYLRMLHNGCACHFNGGRYAFITRRDEAFVAAEHALAAGAVVASLHDHRSRSKQTPPTQLLGRPFGIPIGMFEWAIQHQRPVYFASLLPQGKGYTLELTRLPTTQSAMELADCYLQQLEHCCRRFPAMWDNWSLWAQGPATSL